MSVSDKVWYGVIRFVGFENFKNITGMSPALILKRHRIFLFDRLEIDGYNIDHIEKIILDKF